jgi:hypothetical protein
MRGPSFARITPSVGNSQLAVEMLFQQPELLGSDFVLPETVPRGVVNAHVGHEGARDLGR